MERRISKLSAEDRALLVKAISKLPDLQASVVVLHFLHGQPIAEIARELRLSHAELIVELHSALISLGRYMEKYDGV